MSKRWTFEEDLMLAEYDGIDANMIAEHDLDKPKGAGSRRVKTLKERGVWPHIQAAVKARAIAQAHHRLAFSQSEIVREHAALDLRDLGELLCYEHQEIVDLYDKRNEEARVKLEDWDRTGFKPGRSAA